MRLFAWLKKQPPPVPDDKPQPTLQSLLQRAVAGLYSVVDPEVGVNIVDLGLVYQIDTDNDAVHIHLTTTAPACPMAHFLYQQAQQAVAAQTGRAAHVELVMDPTWTPAMMSAAARRQLGGESV
ncbi:MAG: DUF59 domain-containing protein [Candidatus Latescibacteria bacterium]|nr:DUF59 domain-containing protein [Candidatus Latescibacterota bacterium]